MTKTAVAYSDKTNSIQAGQEVAEGLLAGLGGEAPQALILFASSSYDVKELLKSVQARCQPEVLVGCSSAGEFISGKHGSSGVSAIALRSDEMRFAASIATGLRENIKSAAGRLAAPFAGAAAAGDDYPHRSMLLLTDALAGQMDDFIEELTLATAGAYQIFGGGAGDDAKFLSTEVFLGLEAQTDGAVALEILSKKPIGIGVRHGWTTSNESLRVTEASGMRLISVNSISAVEFIEEYAAKTKQHFDRANPIPFFIHNTLGIQTANGFKLRVPLSVEPDGSLLCAADIPVGSMISIMSSTGSSAAEAAALAVGDALAQIAGFKPKAALFFDCVATRLKLSGEFGLELAAFQKNLGEGVSYAGCNTYGQIARVTGQFNGFHNCTAVVCVIAD